MLAHSVKWLALEKTNDDDDDDNIDCRDIFSINDTEVTYLKASNQELMICSRKIIAREV